MSVIQSHGETAARRDDELTQFLMSVATATLSSRNVIQIICPLHVERNILAVLDDGNIAFSVAVMLVELDYRAVIDGAFIHCSKF